MASKLFCSRSEVADNATDLSSEGGGIADAGFATTVNLAMAVDVPYFTNTYARSRTPKAVKAMIYPALTAMEKVALDI